MRRSGTGRGDAAKTTKATTPRKAAPKAAAAKPAAKKAAAPRSAAKEPGARKTAVKGPAARKTAPSARPTPEAETTRARTALTGRRTTATPTPERETAKARTGPGGVTRAAALPKKAPKTVVKAPARGTKLRTTRARGEETVFAPEAMPRIRKTVDRPAAKAKTAAKAPRDRSQAKEPGLRELGWSDVAQAGRTIARTVSRAWTPEVVIGVAKGGVFAGQEVASVLKADFFPVRVHRRSRDGGFRAPAAANEMPAEIRDRRTLIVDDIAGTGATLEAATEAARTGGAAEIRTATLVVREKGFRPDYFALETDDLVVFPWDYEPTTGAVGMGDEDPGDMGV